LLVAKEHDSDLPTPLNLHDHLQRMHERTAIDNNDRRTAFQRLDAFIKRVNNFANDRIDAMQSGQHEQRIARLHIFAARQTFDANLCEMNMPAKQRLAELIVRRWTLCFVF
jgi:hypothetical protein